MFAPFSYFLLSDAISRKSACFFRPKGDSSVEEFMIDEMVAGQFKFYRQTCFNEIGGFVNAS